MSKKQETKQSVAVRVELRRNDNDFIDGKRAYYVYFYSPSGCFGSAKMTANEIFPIEVASRTKKEESNFLTALDKMQDDIKSMAALMDETGENQSDITAEVGDQWVIKKRGRPSIDEKPLIRSTILLTQEDKDKLKILGGAAWIRNRIRAAKIDVK